MHDTIAIKMKNGQAAFIEQLFVSHSGYAGAFPDKEQAEDFIDRLFDFLFLPATTGKRHTDGMHKEFESLKTVFSRLINDILCNDERSRRVAASFFTAIPELYNRMMKDAGSILQFDPAASSMEEVLIAYPGFYATAVYRLANCLWNLDVKIVARIFSEYAHGKTGIDIHPGASIGDSFFIDHGTGIVIGETAIIRDHVKLYQGVTLGALNVKKGDISVKRHPTIENNVTIYAGATILGGETVIGHDSIIGGNVWLTYSVQPHSVVYHKSEIRVRDNNPFPEPVDFSI